MLFYSFCLPLALYCSLAQATLASPLCKATQEARSPFLKCEAFRLLSMLFSSKPDSDGTELEKAAAKGIEDAQEEFLDSVEAALHDAELRKAKRVRSVLKALEKFLHCLSPPGSPELMGALSKVNASVVKLGESDSNAVKAACTKLTEEIDAKVSELKEAAPTPSSKPEVTEQPSSTSKKSKKKKKKKKR